MINKGCSQCWPTLKSLKDSLAPNTKDQQQLEKKLEKANVCVTTAFPIDIVGSVSSV